jgi:cysteine synthase A
MRVAESILDLIGNTPMVRISNIAKNVQANVLAKLEYLNPSGSLKDRIALKMIEDAEHEGVLRAGYTIVEASTGNTGISLSFVGTLKGYTVVIYETIPGQMGEQKIRMMRNYGAEVVVMTPKEMENLRDRSVSGAEIELPGRNICLDLETSDPRVWWARQFSNPGNSGAHNQTAKEILQQTKGKVDRFVCSIGTGGTLMGIAEVLKNELPNVRVIGIQPAGSEVTMRPGRPYPRSPISGGIVSDMLEKPHLIDEIVRVTDEEAVGMTYRLWREEGLFAGVSSGANVLVAIEQAKRLSAGSNVVTVLPDSGDRYLTEMHYVT